MDLKVSYFFNIHLEKLKLPAAQRFTWYPTYLGFLRIKFLFNSSLPQRVKRDRQRNAI